MCLTLNCTCTDHVCTFFLEEHRSYFKCEYISIFILIVNRLLDTVVLLIRRVMNTILNCWKDGSAFVQLRNRANFKHANYEFVITLGMLTYGPLLYYKDIILNTDIILSKSVTNVIYTYI